MAGGFRPVQDISGNDYVGKVQTYAVSSGHATLLAVGDLVTITGTAEASTGIAYVDAATAGADITGAIVAIVYNPSNLEQAGMPAGTGGYVNVAIDPNTLFVATATTVAVTDVGSNSDITATAATLAGGLAVSNMVIAGSYPTAGGSAQIRIEGLVGAAGSNVPVYCRINESTVKSTTGV